MDAVAHTLAFVQAYHANDHTGHGADHVMRVFNTAQKLLNECTEPVDKEVLLLAALLHDVDDHKINPNGHVAEEYLQGLGLATKTQQRVLETIAPISYSVSGAHPNFTTIEQKLLSDADKLDAIGAIGISRAITYGASNGRPLFDPNDGNHTIGHFFEKLLLLREAMQTEAGKHEAEHRHHVMVDWLTELFTEINASPEWFDRLKRYKN